MKRTPSTTTARFKFDVSGPRVPPSVVCLIKKNVIDSRLYDHVRFRRPFEKLFGNLLPGMSVTSTPTKNRARPPVRTAQEDTPLTLSPQRVSDSRVDALIDTRCEATDRTINEDITETSSLSTHR